MFATLLFLISTVLGSTPAGNLDCSKDHYTIPNFDCGDGTFQDGTVSIYYPTALNDTYPMVSFLHGSGGGHFDDLCYSTASLGIVVVAVAKGVCGDLTLQQLHAIDGSQTNPELHPALSHVKYNSVGVMGHSMGGAFSMGSATHAKYYNIKAMVASHGGSQNAAPDIPNDVPCLFVTGSADPKRHKLYWAYSATTARPAIFANLEGGKHMEPAGAGRMNEFMAHFQGCYLIPRQESCDKIYGDAPDSLCHKYPMVDCDIQKQTLLKFRRKWQ